MDTGELLDTAARALAVYALILVVIRWLGKRTVGNFAAFDLLVALMLGEMVDEIIYGDVSFLQGATAIAVIAGAQRVNSWLTWWGHGADKLLEGTPTTIIRDGKLVEEGMRKERMNVKEVMGHLRQSSVRDLREVKLAVVEDDGHVSVLLREWAEPAKRADVDQALGEARQEDTRGNEDASHKLATDSPENI